MNFYESIRNNLKENDDYVYGFEEIIDTIGSAEEYSEIYDAISHILDDDIRVDAEQSVEQCEADGDDVETASSIVCSDILDKWRYDENTPTTRKDFLASSKKESEKLKESFFNPGKYFQLLQDIEDESVDFSKWNSSNQEQRDAMVRPALEKFWETYREEMTQADIDALYDDLEDSNYHTEYRILEGIINDSMKDKFKTESVETYSSNGDEDAEVADYIDFNCDSKLQDGVNGEKILRRDDFDELFEQGIKEAFKLEDKDMDDLYDKGILPNGQDLWDFQTTVRSILSYRGYETIYETDDERNAEEGDLIRIVGGLANGGIESSLQDKDNNWIVGDVNIDGVDYRVNAKVFDEGSKFGINNGTVSKLWISKDGETIVNYDRGWDIKPKAENKTIYDTILSLVEEFRLEHPVVKESESLQEKDSKKDYEDYCKDLNIDPKKKSSKDKYIKDYGKNYATTNGIKDYDKAIEQVKKDLKEEEVPGTYIVYTGDSASPLSTDEFATLDEAIDFFKAKIKELPNEMVLELHDPNGSSLLKYTKQGEDGATCYGNVSIMNRVLSDYNRVNESETFSHSASISYGPDDISDVEFVVDNREDFPEIKDEDIHKAFEDAKPSIWFNDTTGREEMWDIKMLDGKYWLMYTGKEDGDSKYHFIIDKNAFNESVKEQLQNVMKEANISSINGVSLNEGNYTMGSCISQIKEIDSIDGFYDKVREIIGYNDKEWNERHGWEDYEIKRLQREADARYEELKNQNKEENK